MAKKTIVGTIASAAIALGVSIAEPRRATSATSTAMRLASSPTATARPKMRNQCRAGRFPKQECHDLLVKRMAHYDQGNEACVKNWSTLPVETRGAFDSFSYNVGNGAFYGSTAAKYLRSGNIAAACNAMLSLMLTGCSISGRSLPPPLPDDLRAYFDELVPPPVKGKRFTKGQVYDKLGEFIVLDEKKSS
ncbi:MULTISPECIES: hypothetical protein [Rhizobium]|uniref:glycoside hydrolase family protein n=1 Tax=Rhizobium TaxID=379 RepID=UPI00124E7773|nr:MULTISPECIES: hypothetical protein [Rhizobium]KAF5887947.1 hypothetical protein FY112_01400 [Rhizobium sp. PEPV16]NKM97167.1 hypothetical protein [Rhizobium leguminosarum bv. viciae]